MATSYYRLKYTVMLSLGVYFYFILFSMLPAAFVYKKLDKPDFALTYLNRSYNIYKKVYTKHDLVSNAVNLVISMNNIGICLKDLGQTKRGADIINKSLKFYYKIIENNKTLCLPNTYYNIGMLFLDLGKYDKANKYFDQVYDLMDDVKQSADKKMPFV